LAGRSKILIVEDEKLLRWSLLEGFRREGYQVHGAENGKEALNKIGGEQYELILMDIKLPVINGIEVLQSLKRTNPQITVIMMTGYGDIETTVEAMRAGAYDYVTKPFNLDEIRTRIERALEASNLQKEVSYLRDFHKKQLGVDNVVSHSDSMRQLLGLVQKMAAASDSTVLILGETGTGKDLVARYIHFRSPRADRPFVDINCAALPDTLLESELMGHEKGAFTDAKAAKRGLFEQANGGTLFMDEIGDMPLAIQAKVLELIETKQFRRLGGLRDLEVDVRIIAATNKNLAKLVLEGIMREDLYYRLKVLSVTLPPLRERKEDIPLLITHFLGQFDRKGVNRGMEMSTQALKHLMSYDWPGNVRELKNVIERAVILNDGPVILPGHLPPEIVEPGVQRGGYDLNELEIPPDGVPLAQIERDLIKRALDMAQGNLSKAARIIHVSRDTLRYRIRKLGIPHRSTP